MRHSIGLAWFAGFLIASAAPLEAQTTVQRARDILNGRAPAPVAPAPVEPPVVETGRRTTVIVPRREIIVVEHIRTGGAWWKNPRYRVITLYYDGDRFYRRPFDRRPLRKVVVYERAGRYYIDEAQWKRDRRRYYGRNHGRWSDDDHRRYDEKWNDERWKDDDRWKDEDKRKDEDKSRDDDKHGSKGNNGRHLGHDKD